MKIDRFEDILAWQKAKELAVAVYQLFGEHKDFGFRDQVIFTHFLLYKLGRIIIINQLNMI